MNSKFHYECCNCGKTFETDDAIYLCPDCERMGRPGIPPLGVLKTVYDYARIRNGCKPDILFTRLKRERFLPLLPLRDLRGWTPLRIGDTPMYQLDPASILPTGDLTDSHPGKCSCGIFVKDDSQNPTFSFKDRASALVSAWAAEHKTGTIIAASTGNAGSSLAGICASLHQKAMIFVPASAPLAKLTQIVMYGARIIPVKGNYDVAFDLSIKASGIFGFYNRNTAYNPFTIEGKKIVAFEIYEQLGHKIPDRIFIPVGDGVILSGAYKGFEDMLNLGIIERMPVLVAVQAEGSRNLIDNLNRDEFISFPSDTIADSISVDVPRNFYMTAGYLRKYNGETMAVTDKEILEASSFIAKNLGMFSEPAAAAAFAGLIKYIQDGKPGPGSRNVVLLTGSGLKDLQSVKPLIHLPEPFNPDTDTLEHLFDKTC